MNNDLNINFELLANYNRWMNENIYHVATKLDPETLYQDLGAYFSSIGGTLNHIMVADIIWLKRFLSHPSEFSALTSVAKLPAPGSLNQILHRNLNQLTRARKNLDQTLIELCQELNHQDLNVSLTYQNTKGITFSKPFSALVQHLFNHQTHHRGQVTTLFSQCGLNPGVTDLLAIIPEQEQL
ncbi:MAG: DinB family protein [Arenicellales bacterium]